MYLSFAIIQQLHQRILVGDTEATEQISSLLHAGLSAALHRSFGDLAQDLVNDSVTDVLIKYLRQPSQLRNQDGPAIWCWFRKAAANRLKDRLRSEQSRVARETMWAQEQTWEKERMVSGEGTIDLMNPAGSAAAAQLPEQLPPAMKQVWFVTSRPGVGLVAAGRLAADSGETGQRSW